MLKRIFRWVRRLFRKDPPLDPAISKALAAALNDACIQHLQNDSEYYQALIRHQDQPRDPIRWGGSR